MRNLLRMIEKANRHLGLKRDQIMTVSLADSKHSIGVLKEFTKVIKDCKPFVFIDGDDEPELQLSAEESKCNLDMPFRTISIERLHGSLVSGSDALEEEDQSRFDTQTLCTVIHEVSPTKYLVYHYQELTDLQTGITYQNILSEQSSSTYFGSVFRHYLDKINHQKLGVQNVLKRVQLGKGKHKTAHVFRQVVYVSARVPKESSGSTRSINWSHRWEVRGHWRKCAYLGKNRDGDYVVEGYTWISAHIRGDEDLPLVSKIRVVK